MSRTIVDLFKTQGFSAIQGVGGYVDFSIDRFEIFHRTAAYAPPPYQKGMKVMVFPNDRDFMPQPWVPRDLATYDTFYLDVVNGFDNFGPLFDFMVPGAEPGSWEEAMRGLKTDENGPRLDMRREIVLQLENRVSMLTDYQLPITETSERTLIAVPAKDVARVKAGLTKFYQKDKDIKRHVLGDLEIWENVPPPKKEVPVVELQMPGEKKRPGRGAQQSDPLMPNAAITVAYGHLMIASHLDFLLKVLQPRQPRDTLGRSIDFQIVSQGLNQLAPPLSAARMFSRGDEEARPTYELIRQGKLPQAQTMLARMLNWFFNTGKNKSRQQKIEGRAMPDYEIVRRNLGPGGTYVVSENGGWFLGWFLKGFLLSKEQPVADATARGSAGTP